MCPPLQYQTECFSALKVPCALQPSTPPPPLASTDLFTVLGDRVLKGNPAMFTQCSQLQGEVGAHSKAGGQDFLRTVKWQNECNLVVSLMPFYSGDMTHGLGEHRASKAVVHFLLPEGFGARASLENIRRGYMKTGQIASGVLHSSAR